MRFLSRCLGLLLAAGAFVAFVIDGTRSVADNVIETQPIGAVWVWASERSFSAAQAAVQKNLSPLFWDRMVMPILTAPFFTLLLVLALFFLWLGRRPRSRVGYVTRG